MKLVKKVFQAITTDLIPIGSFHEQDWLSSIIQNLNQQLKTMAMKKLKDFLMVKLYRGINGVLAQAYL